MGFFTANTRQSTPKREGLTLLRELYRLREAQSATAKKYTQLALGLRRELPRVALLFAGFSQNASAHAEALNDLLLQNNISVPSKQDPNEDLTVYASSCNADTAQELLHACGAEHRDTAMRYRLLAKAVRSPKAREMLLHLADEGEEQATALDSMGARLSRS